MRILHIQLSWVIIILNRACKYCKVGLWGCSLVGCLPPSFKRFWGSSSYCRYYKIFTIKNHGLCKYYRGIWFFFKKLMNAQTMHCVLQSWEGFQNFDKVISKAHWNCHFQTWTWCGHLSFNIEIKTKCQLNTYISHSCFLDFRRWMKGFGHFDKVEHT
jgi:hypothetical protein